MVGWNSFVKDEHTNAATDKLLFGGFTRHTPNITIVPVVDTLVVDDIYKITLAVSGTASDTSLSAGFGVLSHFLLSAYPEPRHCAPTFSYGTLWNAGGVRTSLANAELVRGFPDITLAIYKAIQTKLHADMPNHLLLEVETVKHVTSVKADGNTKFIYDCKPDGLLIDAGVVYCLEYKTHWSTTPAASNNWPVRKDVKQSLYNARSMKCAALIVDIGIRTWDGHVVVDFDVAITKFTPKD